MEYELPGVGKTRVGPLWICFRSRTCCTCTSAGDFGYRHGDGEIRDTEARKLRFEPLRLCQHPALSALHTQRAIKLVFKLTRL